MSVRAKFRVHNVTESGSQTRVQMSPVYGESEENKSFFEATPSGSIEMWIKNKVAAEFFKPNAEVYVDFSLAAAPA